MSSSEVADGDKVSKLNQIYQRTQPHDLPLILEEDKAVWSENVEVATPLAVCLDRLQAEERAYKGCFLPQLRQLKDSLLLLARDQTITHAGNLVTYLPDQGRTGRDQRGLKTGLVTCPST